MSRLRGLAGLDPMPFRPLRVAGATFGVSLVLGCAAGVAPGIPRPAVDPHPPSSHRIVGVPFVPGDPGACGPAALASVLTYWGDAVTVQEIADALAVPSLAGVLPMDLARFAGNRAPGASVLPDAGTMPWLRDRVAADQPVVVFLDLGFGPVRQGHFVVVVGYDDAAERVLLYSGRDAAAAMSYRRFASSWARAGWWALALNGRRDAGGAPPS
ncbi:MAG: peptidase C39 family protein [Nitrospirota bacterium]